MSTSPLRISDNKRFLQRSDGTPFFYLADTAWELFHRLNREEAEYYLEDRAAKKFSVIQAVILAEEDGLNVTNPYGDVPLLDCDPTRPNEPYFAHVDWVLQKAATLGLTIGVLPTWGDKWNLCHGVGPEIFTPENAAIYGEYLGRRYRDYPVIWILGGDRPIHHENHRAIIEAMVVGIKAGEGTPSGSRRHLMTFHPCGQQTSSQYFHHAPWLDFNMYQTGHTRGRDNYNSVAADYALTPVKPCLDGEPGYENHPHAFDINNEYLDHSDVRNFAYWSLFAGAFGHTYGCHAIWQFWQEGRKPVNEPRIPWQQALQLPGAAQMQHTRKLLESRPYFSRIPDQSLIVGSQSDGASHLQATRDQDGRYALIYFAQSTQATIDLSVLDGRVLASWFDPRDGSIHRIGEFTPQRHEFQPPRSAAGADWVLVADVMT